MDLVKFEWSDADKKEEKEIEESVREGCGCEVLNGKPCSAQFTTSHYREMRNYCAELDRDSLDLVVLGQIMALTSTSEMVIKRKTERKKSTVLFRHLSQKVNDHTYETCE